ncbi:MAG: isocitrate/isopropylmalate dehydrogenase family protein [Thermoplasmata archaeon]|jgi:isopropylmalate/isohomocitrate dehydrogenase-like protein|nr:isocitrate/isopropylmalate dehydrogenase family protein [Thermoplasmata archaeon]
MKRICVLPGDGIGPEVVASAVKVMEAASDELEFVHADIGRAAYERHGSYLPGETLKSMRECDSSLFGAVTTVESADYSSPVLTFRKELDLYANVRPVRSLVQISGRPPIDVVIVRENTEGMYTQNEVFDDVGVTTMRKVTRKASERIVGFAIRYARAHGRRRLTCVHKSNVLKASDGLFVSTFRELMASGGRDLEGDEQLVDSCALKLVTEPSAFDVIVTLNLYGDILSDVAAGVAGGLGFAPSGNIGDRHSVFEPAHGSAPDIAGKGIANPTAAILAAAMMLKHLGLGADGSRMEAAVMQFYSSGHLTADLGGRHGSESFTEHVLKNLKPGPKH